MPRSTQSVVHIPYSVSGGKLWGWGRVAGGQCTGKDLRSCLLVPPSAAVSWVDDRLLGPQIPLCLLEGTLGSEDSWISEPRNPSRKWLQAAYLSGYLLPH